MDCKSGFENKIMSNMCCVRPRLAIGAPKLSNDFKIKVKTGKMEILRPIIHLKQCTSINGLQKWFCKQNNTTYVSRHIGLNHACPYLAFLNHNHGKSWGVGNLATT